MTVTQSALMAFRSAEDATRGRFTLLEIVGATTDSRSVAATISLAAWSSGTGRLRA